MGSGDELLAPGRERKPGSMVWSQSEQNTPLVRCVRPLLETEFVVAFLVRAQITDPPAASASGVTTHPPGPSAPRTHVPGTWCDCGRC